MSGVAPIMRVWIRAPKTMATLSLGVRDIKTETEMRRQVQSAVAAAGRGRKMLVLSDFEVVLPGTSLSSSSPLSPHAQYVDVRDAAALHECRGSAVDLVVVVLLRPHSPAATNVYRTLVDPLMAMNQTRLLEIIAM